jgi:catechol 2,3-dioxygenase-like lactoylglutathione lyase family enzyme
LEVPVALEFVHHHPEWYHVLFRVRDADLSIQFYGEYLGMAAVKDQRDDEGKRWVWLKSPENPAAPLFVLVEDPQAKRPSPGSVNLPCFSFRVPELKTFEELSERAKKDGCILGGPGLKGHSCLVADPDGNPIEFSYLPSPK